MADNLHLNIFVAVLLLTTIVIANDALKIFGRSRDKDQCMEGMGNSLCRNRLEVLQLCGQLMPDNEEAVVFDCAKPLARLVRKDPPKGWYSLGNILCRPPVAKKFFDLMKCFDNKMNDTVQKGEVSPENDGLFPEEHFKCRDYILNEGVKSLSRPCKQELGLRVRSINLDD